LAASGAWPPRGTGGLTARTTCSIKCVPAG